MADYNPFQGMLNPNMRQTSLWDLRMMSAANRTETPFERGMRGTRSGGMAGNSMLGNLAGMANEPDYSQFTYDPAMRQQAIAAGVQPLEASQVKQNVLLPNTGFFGKHPRLAGALEGAIFGGAATPSSGAPASAGQNIADVLEGAIGGQRARQGFYRQQFARPFEAAGALEGLQDIRQRRDLQEAEIQHLRAENQKLGRPDHDFRAFGVSRNDPEIATIDNTSGEVKFSTNPLYDPIMAGGSTPEDQFFAAKRAEAKAAGKTPTSNDIGAWQQEWKGKGETVPRTLVAVPDGKGGVTYQEAKPGSHFNVVPETPSQAGAGAAAPNKERDKFILENNKVTSTNLYIWRGAGIKVGDKAEVVSKKLADYYDTKVAPYLSSGAGAPGSESNPHKIP